MNRKQVIIGTLVFVALVLAAVGLIIDDVYLIIVSLFTPIPIIIMMQINEVMSKKASKEAMRNNFKVATFIFLGAYALLRGVYSPLIIQNDVNKFFSVPLIIVLLTIVVLIGYRSYRFNMKQGITEVRGQDPGKTTSPTTPYYATPLHHVRIMLTTIILLGWLIFSLIIVLDHFILEVIFHTNMKYSGIEFLSLWLAFGIGYIFYIDRYNGQQLGHLKKED